MEPRLAGLLALAEMPAGARDELFAAWRTSSSGWPRRSHGAGVQGPAVGRPGTARLRRAPPRAGAICRSSSWRWRGLSSRSPAGLGERRAQRDADAPGAPAARRRGGDGPGLSRASRPRPSTDRRPREGIPLYAVETVRMLVDRGRSCPTKDWTSSGSSALDELAVPETLQALIASRLDALDPRGRCCSTPRSWARASRSPVAGVAGEGGGARAAARAWCAASCSSTRWIRARRSAASTSSSRPSCARSPTVSSRGGSALAAPRRRPLPGGARRRRAGRGPGQPLPGRLRGHPAGRRPTPSLPRRVRAARGRGSVARSASYDVAQSYLEQAISITPATPIVPATLAKERRRAGGDVRRPRPGCCC